MKKLRFARCGLAVTLAIPSSCTFPIAYAAPEPVAPTVATAVATAKAPFEDEIIAFETADKKSPPPAGAVLFTGSSSIRLWSTLAADFPEITTLNRGFGGSTIADSVRYADRISIPYKPKMIVFFAGGNDLEKGRKPAEVLQDFEDYVIRVHAALPETRIVYISINPSVARVGHRNLTVETNNLIAQWIHENNGKVAPLVFIDTYPYLLSPAGEPRPEILRKDGLHLNADGYALWTSLLRPQILALLGVKPGAKPQPTAR